MIHLLFSVVVIVVICALAVWVMGMIAPGHPALIDRLIWVVCVVLVVLMLISAFGVFDVPVPKLR